MSLLDRGLDLSNLDEMQPEEFEAFKLHYATRDGRAHPGLDMWVEQGRPDYLKRYRLFAHYLATAPTDAVTPDNVLTNRGNANKASGSFACIYWYGLLGFEEGNRYSLTNLQNGGFSKDECLQGIAVTCLHSGPRGMETMADVLRTYEWKKPTEPPHFGPGWVYDRSRIEAGLDYGTPDLLPTDLSRLEQWCGDTLGEIPAYVRFLSRHNPPLLKAWRNRWENLLTTLPNQLLPTILFQVHMLRQDKAGIRENALLARAWGVSHEEMVHALSAWMVFGSVQMASLAQEVVGDLFDNWPN
ncbi:MAG: hypothetical protein AB7O39_16765 [Flavobacteriaceae bacterium]